MSLGIKKNDTILIISGDEKNKRGRVLDVSPKKGKILVEKINIIKRHMKPSKKYTQGGIVEKEAPLHRSNMMLVCPKCDKATRIEYKILESGTKVRVCKKCREVLD
ncbi:MAG: 50S ribosomal protein L24 [Nitrospirae bacterium]|nr:50S ribosomal protein L24 [Nitrospirota bacterium]MDP3297790.1 50S ribosomal protein L24 [Thermodesulfovibrionia bacterium]